MPTDHKCFLPFCHHPSPSELLATNARWAKGVVSKDPGYFTRNAEGQAPKVLWIGCSDSRVPEGVVTNSMPGDIFAERNIANQVPLKDDGVQSILEYAINELQVDHVVVVGHTRCGGVRAALRMANSNPDQLPSTSLERWLTPLALLARSLRLPDDERYWQFLAEENVKAQIRNISESALFLESSRKDPTRRIEVHGWIYELEKGLLKVLDTRHKSLM